MDRKNYLPALIEEYMENKEYRNATTLCALMNAMGSDKGDSWHNYTTFYSKLFEPLRDKKINLFELGIGTNFLDLPSNMGAGGKPGASLYAWEKYFPNADIYGADIDKRILFTTSRIKTYYCDQRDPASIEEMFKNKELCNTFFDIMIDDGLHEFEANLTFLIHSIHKLKEGGIYIVEDLTAKTTLDFEQTLPELQEQLSCKWIGIVTIPSEVNRIDNALLLIVK